MLKKIFVTFACLTFLLFLLSDYKFKINIYGCNNFDKSSKGSADLSNKLVRPKEIFSLLKHIISSKIVDKACILFRTSSEIDIFIFEKLPSANLFISGKSYIIDRNYKIIHEGIEPSVVSIFCNEIPDSRDLKQNLIQKFVRKADCLIINYPIYQLISNNNSIVYYNPQQVELFYNKILDKTFSNKRFCAQFYPNDRFSVFLK